MSHPHPPKPDLSGRRDSEPVRSPFADVAGRFANWLAGVDRDGEDGEGPARPGLDPHDELAPSSRIGRFASRVAAASPATVERPQRGPGGTVALADADPERDDEPELDAEPESASRFPVAPLGYNRAAVDEHLARMERELMQLRAVREPAMSITEELEWIGEQTSSILVVAHDKAHETTRRAQEQAERTVAEAVANAQAITEQARRRLSELDAETDQVWRERERLLDDVRVVSAALAELADEASGRFPAADGAGVSALAGTTVAFEALERDRPDLWAADEDEDAADLGLGSTRAFTSVEEAEASGVERPELRTPDDAADDGGQIDRPDHGGDSLDRGDEGEPGYAD